jgi:hypothetical protein
MRDCSSFAGLKRKRRRWPPAWNASVIIVILAPLPIRLQSWRAGWEVNIKLSAALKALPPDWITLVFGSCFSLGLRMTRSNWYREWDVQGGRVLNDRSAKFYWMPIGRSLISTLTANLWTPINERLATALTAVGAENRPSANIWMAFPTPANRILLVGTPRAPLTFLAIIA